MKAAYPNCLYSMNGCKGPCDCLYCGFDMKEAERRRTLPLTRAKDGTSRKLIRKRKPPAGGDTDKDAGESKCERSV